MWYFFPSGRRIIGLCEQVEKCNFQRLGHGDGPGSLFPETLGYDNVQWHNLL